MVKGFEDLANQQGIEYGTLSGSSTLAYFKVRPVYPATPGPPISLLFPSLFAIKGLDSRQCLSSVSSLSSILTFSSSLSVVFLFFGVEL